jgi:hypothetical protein
MGRLSSPEQVRERAAECRARAAHPILRPDAATWLDLADTWDRLAEAMEASADEGRIDDSRTGVVEEPMEKKGREGAIRLVRGDALPNGGCPPKRPKKRPRGRR